MGHNERPQQADEHKRPQMSASFTFANYKRVPTGCLDGPWDFAAAQKQQPNSDRMSTNTKDRVLMHREQSLPLDREDEGKRSNASVSMGGRSKSGSSDSRASKERDTGMELAALKSGEVHVMYKGKWDESVKSAAKKL